MATKREVEAKLRDLITRLSGAQEAQASLARTLPDTRVVVVRVPDLGADYWTLMESGRMEGIHRGLPEKADITIRVDSDTLVAIVNGDASLFSAFVSGQVKIEASISDLLRLRKLA